MPNSSFAGKHDVVFKTLANFDEKIQVEEQGVFMRDLIKSQAEQLRITLEQQQYQRCIENTKNEEEIVKKAYV